MNTFGVRSIYRVTDLIRPRERDTLGHRWVWSTKIEEVLIKARLCWPILEQFRVC